MIRVVLADDQALVRVGFTSILDTEDDIEVVAEASNGDEMGHLRSSWLSSRRAQRASAKAVRPASVMV